MTRYESPEFYVTGVGPEFISGTENFDIFRCGEMKINDGKNDTVYRTTQDLLNAGINTDEKLASGLEDEEDLSYSMNPWFEVQIKNQDYDFESLIFHTLSEAEAGAELEEEELAKQS